MRRLRASSTARNGCAIISSEFAMSVSAPELVISARNPLVKEVRRAVAKGSLTESGCAIAETFHLLDEALRSSARIEAVIAAESARRAVADRLAGRVRWIVVTDELFATVATTETSQGVIALVKPKAWTVEQVFTGQSMVAVLDGVQDPGNAGAIVRAAEAFGATGALFVKGSASPHNPKTLRASAGSLFRLPNVAGVEALEVRAALEQQRLTVWAADPRAQTSLANADLTRPFALVVGSEAHGVSGAFRESAAGLRIPTTGVESLNAAMAAGIILHEASRQRGALR